MAIGNHALLESEREEIQDLIYLHAKKEGETELLQIEQVVKDKNSPFDSLSKCELEITLMVINGWKPQKIAEKLGISSKTVNSYRYRIFDKLDIKSDVSLTLLATRCGLLALMAES